MKDKITIITKKDWFTDIIESKEWTQVHMGFFAHKKEHIAKMKNKCDAKRPCYNTDLHYCEPCDLTLCSRHYR